MVDDNEFFTFFPLEEGKIETISEGSFILLVKADQTPPHLMVLVSGLLFDWSVYGVRNAVPFQPFFKHISNKGHAIIAVQLNELSLESCKKVFRAENNKQFGTCLDAIIKVIQESYHTTSIHGKVIFELIEELNKENAILGYKKWNIASDQLIVKRYDREEVKRIIHQLRND